MVEKFPHLRSTVCEKLSSALPEVKSGKVFRGILWILGEYVDSVDDIQMTMQQIRKVIGEVPILSSEQKLLDEALHTGEIDEDKEKPKEGGSRPKVLADGTYATETAFTSSSAANLEAVKAASKPPLRSTQSLFYFPLIFLISDFCAALILGGDFFTAAVLAASLTKLVLHFDEKSQDKVACNTLRAEVGHNVIIIHGLLLTSEHSQCLLWPLLYGLDNPSSSVSQLTKIPMSVS